MLPEPLPGGLIVGTRVSHQRPVPPGVVHLPEVHQLVDDDVLPDRGRHQDQPPVQTDMAVSPARSPARALIADGHARHGETMPRGEPEHEAGQFDRRAIAKIPPLGRTQRSRVQPRALPGDPFEMAQAKSHRVALRSAPWNRHSHTAVVVHAKHVASRSFVTDEVELEVRRCGSGRIEWQRNLQR